MQAMNELSAFAITRKWPPRPRRQAAGDDYGIADISTFPWVNKLIGSYNAGELERARRFAVLSASGASSPHRALL
jgi:hypothetical protein